MDIEIKYNGLKVKHLKYLTNIKVNDDVKDIVTLISNVCNIDKGLLYRCELNELLKVYNEIINDLDRVMTIEDLPLKTIIEIGNKKYKFVEEAHQPVGWFIDISQLKITPEILMALYYIEAEAKNYSELDENGFQKYDTIKRSLVLGDCPLEYYIMLTNYLKKKSILMDQIRMSIIKIEKMILEAGLLQSTVSPKRQTSIFIKLFKCLTKPLR